MKPYIAPLKFAGHLEGDCIAERISSLRTLKGMTVKEFADFTGLKPRQVSNFEANRQFSTKTDPTIDQIARKCGVQPVWLYAGSDAPQRLWPEWWRRSA